MRDLERFTYEIDPISSFQIKYDSAVKDEKCPYQVIVDQNQILNILNTLGVDKKQARKLTIKLIDNDIITPDGRSAGASYGGSTIYISAGTCWRFLINELNKIDAILEKQGLSEEAYSTTKASTHEAISARIQQEVDDGTVHELCHFSRDVLEKNRIVQLFKRMNFSGIGKIIRHRATTFTPQGVADEEQATDNLAQIIKQNHQYKNIITVIPRHI
ncbi:hypothetical protein HGB07_00760 [Candidatus Roizmanbacteria bacterium]|nr:hypothetical protein [Candidatus Roizmanbacteria bacterium]